MGIVVPARDEEARIRACMTAVSVALDGLPDGVESAVCVVLDRCRDATASVLRDVLAADPAPAVDILHNHRAATIGELRDLGLRRVLRRLAPAPEARTWLLSTDADSTVPPGWVRDHLRHADAGADAVAGTVALDDGETLDPVTRARHAAVADAGIHRIGAGLGHHHAYAANLGARADAYTGVGGFPAVPAGEDHALLARLRHAGHRVATPVELRVVTSARLDGRATGGLATLLTRLRSAPSPEAPQEVRPEAG